MQDVLPTSIVNTWPQAFSRPSGNTGLETTQPASVSDETAALLTALGVRLAPNPEALHALEAENNVRLLERRRELLKDALTTTQTAKLLGTSREIVQKRFRSGALLAMEERGAVRFPIWQFDSDSPDGVVTGLPDALRVLSIPPFSQINWFMRSNPYLEGRTPLEALKQGETQRVVATARAVGAA